MVGLPYSEVDVLRLAGDTIFQRGQSYYRQQAVVGMIQRGAVLQAEVEGSEIDPYAVSITLGDNGIESATCSCPFEHGEVCKHVVAVLLAALQHPEWVEQRAPLATTLAELDRDQLRSLLLDVAAQHPDIADLVEQRIGGLAAAPAGPPATSPVVRPDLALILSQIKALQPPARSRRYHDYHDYGGSIDYAEFQRLAEQTRPYLEAGDGGSAALVLEAITAAYIEQGLLSDYGYDEYDQEDGSMLVEELDTLWAEALLSPNVSAADRKKWAKKLQQWQDSLEEYGLDVPLGLAIVAASEGWDTPEIRHILAHGTLKNPAALGNNPWYLDDLAQLRLNLLGRQQRSTEYLNLALALGQHQHYAAMLAQLGRAAEALEYGLEHLTRPDQALYLAQALWASDNRAAARQIAAHGLSVPSSTDAYRYSPTQADRTTLARTLRDWALGEGDHDQALDAALIVLKTTPSLTDYQAAQTIAGAGWERVQPQALEAIRHARGRSDTARVEIFLHENLLDDAIAVADQQYAGSPLIDIVATAAIASRPDWVIEACRKQANLIMDSGKSAEYAAAIEWLKKVKAACLAANRLPDWQLLLSQLLATHKRKYKLVPMLEALRKP